MELNGFKIEKYNQYGFEENAKMATCPLCSESRKKKTDKCVKLFWIDGMAKCFHCGEVLQLHTYKKKVDTKPYSRPEWLNQTELSTNLVKWFEGRKISQFVLRHMKITEGKEWMPQTKKEVNTVQFNYFRDGELINIKFRDGAKNFKMAKDAEKIFYNLDNIRTSKEVIICEGEMDSLSYVEAGLWYATSTPNGSTTGTVNLEFLDNCYEYFENKEKIYLALDNDEPGQNVQKELLRRLGAERCYIVNFGECKDANEYLIKHGKDELAKTIENAELSPLENIEEYKDIKAQLHDFYLNGMPKGFQIGLNDFDDIFSTNTSQYIVVTGIPTSGKSDFVDQMCVGYNIKYNWKIAYCSTENKPTVLHVDKITRKILGTRPRNEVDLNSERFKNVEKHVDENFYFMDFEKYDLQTVLKKGEELVKRKGIKCLVIDPYNKVRLKESLNKNINEYTSDYLTLIDEFCKKNDVLVILVAHPVKMKTENGKILKPSFYDIKGGGEFYDMSYHGLLVHRNYDNGTVMIKVLKCKFQHLGENGAEVDFCWNPINGRYEQFEGNGTSEIDAISPILTNHCLIEKKVEQKEADFWTEETHKFEVPDCPF